MIVNILPGQAPGLVHTPEVVLNFFPPHSERLSGMNFAKLPG